MWRRLFFVLPLILCATAIKVPVDNNDNSTEAIPDNTEEQPQNKPTYYTSDEANLDSYLVPPDPHKPEEVLPGVVTPATYLLPPSAKQTDYFYNPAESGQSDWYPIAQNAPLRQYDAIPIFVSDQTGYENIRVGKAIIKDKILVPVPSTHLEPPLIDAPNDYIVTVPSKDLELPSEEIDLPKNNNLVRPVEPTLSLQLLPPKPYLAKHKTPTKLYPKKFSGFKPVPIPIAQFAENTLNVPPRARPAKLFKPIASSEVDYLLPDEKAIYLYKSAEEKRRLKGEDGAVKHPELEVSSAVETYGEPASSEQETSETNNGYTGRNTYPAPLRQSPPAIPQRDGNAAPAPGERTEFRMHGMKGPHSYEFGYDTGKGKNRQFRYEERDNDGQVRGHYGYMDRSGKLRVVNYSAHPEHGFHAEAPQEKE